MSPITLSPSRLQLPDAPTVISDVTRAANQRGSWRRINLAPYRVGCLGRWQVAGIRSCASRYGISGSGKSCITFGRIMQSDPRWFCIELPYSLRVSLIQPSLTGRHCSSLMPCVLPKSNQRNKSAGLKHPLVSSAPYPKRRRQASNQVQSYSVILKVYRSNRGQCMQIPKPKASSTLDCVHRILTCPPQELDPQRRRSLLCRSGRRLLPGPFSQMGYRVPFGDPSSKLRVALVPDERPAFFVPNVVVGVDGTVLDQ